MNMKLAVLAGPLYFLLGCGATDPGLVVPGAFRLVSVGGNALPATLQGSVALESEVLMLRSGGAAIVDRVSRNLFASDPQQEIRTRVEGTWHLDDDHLTVTLPTRRLQFRVEAEGLELRLQESEAIGGPPGQPDVFYELLYRREGQREPS